jgi:toxin ParE1/3/4
MPNPTLPGARTLVLSAPALLDIRQILQWTQATFGAAGRTRYEALISTALIDLRANPTRAGVNLRNDIATGIYIYHLASSRKRVATTRRVAQPRHLVVFRVTSSAIEVARVLHDAMDFVQHSV